MATLNLTSKVKIEQPEPETKIAAFEDKIPANWIISAVDSGIEAYSTKTNERFKGSIEDFNKLLRG